MRGGSKLQFPAKTANNSPQTIEFGSWSYRNPLFSRKVRAFITGLPSKTRAACVKLQDLADGRLSEEGFEELLEASEERVKMVCGAMISDMNDYNT